LLIDGYIAHTFHSRRAEQYFLGLLKSDSIPPIKTLSYPGREGHFFLTPDPSSRLLDRAVVNSGSVVPQEMWPLRNVHDMKRYVVQVSLRMPIFFEGVDGRLGLSLEAAAAGRCNGLRSAQEFAPLGYSPTIYIRIVWPSYKDFKRQVQIHDETRDRNPITISRFAHHIGQSVDAFFKVRPSDLLRTTPVLSSDVIVIGAINTSAGSWMPILQLGRYIVRYPPTFSVPTYMRARYQLHMFKRFTPC
ncbi:hypothetical protein BJY52DRAFT_1122801, partial [Lactarius psammicola]